MADMDPTEAAEYAQGAQQAPQGGLQGDGLQDGPSDAQPTTTLASGPLGRLMDGDAPGPSVQELRRDYEMPKDMAIASRGILRTSTGSGVPPLFEIGIGGALAYLRRTGDQNGADELESAHDSLERAGE